MLTFLRKIRKSLIESGSTRKPASPAGRYLLYAIGEIALVVIGILIALQINNWNEWKKERKVETKVMKEVAENLEDNLQRLQIHIDRCNIDNHSTDIILGVIDLHLPYVDSLDKHFVSALNPVDEGSFLSFVGYESLKNVGFELIRNDQLKQEVINLFEGTYKDLKARYDRVHRTRDPELIQFTLQHFYRKGHAYTLTPFDFDNLIEDKQFRSWMHSLKGYRDWISLTLFESYSETKRVLQLIQGELGEE